MSANSKIQWTDHTFNAWEGCTKVAPECKNCYAETLVDHRFGRAKWGKNQPRRRTSENLWKGPIAWNKTAICTQCGQSELIGSDDCRTCGRNFSSANRRRPRVFCLSLGDWLDEEVPIEWLADLLLLIHDTPNLDWQLLTKRPQNLRSRIEQAQDWHFDFGDRNVAGWLSDWRKHGIAPLNVWIGVSAGADQKAALDIPAKVHFLSCEPMLHPLNTNFPEPFKTAEKFDWIIFGGESGKKARKLRVDWIRQGLAFCRANKIAAFVKQMGRNVVDRNDAGFDGDEGDWPMGTETREMDTGYQGTPVRVLLRDSHGGDMEEWPETLRVREFPVSDSEKLSEEETDVCPRAGDSRDPNFDPSHHWEQQGNDDISFFVCSRCKKAVEI